MSNRYYIFSWEVPVDDVVSENFLYKPGYKNGHSYLYLDGTVAEYKDHIYNFLQNNFDLSVFTEFPKVYGILAEYRFYMKEESFWKRDVTNAVKAVEDAFFSVLREKNSVFDDSQVIVNIATKIPSKESCISGRFMFFFDPSCSEYLMNNSIFDYLIKNY